MWNNSAFGDGNSTGAGFFSNGANPGSPSKNKAVRRLQSIMPLCIRQIRDHPEEEFKMLGLHVQLVTIVGIVKEFEVQSTKATYEIEDHTGRIKAIWWLENENNTEPDLPMIKEGCYVKAHGSLRSEDNEKILMVLKMFPVDNINVVTSHLLDVMHTRLEAENLIKNAGSSLHIKKNNPGAELANSMSFMYNDVEMGGSSSTGFTPIQEKVYRILQPVNSTTGLHRSNIMQQFPAHQHREIDAALEFLINEGHAYSTVDNDHFKATDSM